MSMTDILTILKPYRGRIMTKMQLRILGGIIILFNLWLIGHYQLEGLMILVLTAGVALFFEFVVVNILSCEKNKKNYSKTFI